MPGYPVQKSKAEGKTKGSGLNIQQAEWMRLYGCINGKVRKFADDSKQSSGVNLNSSEWKQCLKS